MLHTQTTGELQENPRQDGELPEHSADIRVGRELLKATMPFAAESLAASWWQVGSTFGLMVAALAGAGLAPWWPVRLALSILGALAMVRGFITYHDFMHGAILRHSRLARVIFEIYAAFALTPPRSWGKSHNYHHGHIGQIEGSRTGSFPVMTTKMWREASAAQRTRYRFERHPMTVLLGYVTIFFWSICLLPLLLNPRKHWDSAVSLAVHFGLLAVLWRLGGFDLAFYVVLLPMTLSSALGGYLFFAQHSFKRMIILSPEAWTFYRAALESSSYMRLNTLMQWFTGNIGYHHIHHLNVKIPFYRLPEAMAALPELQHPGTTTLRPRDILRCFSLKLWDAKQGCMVGYP